MAETTPKEVSLSECATFYNQGYTIKEIAHAIGCSYTRARNIPLKKGIKLRTKKEAMENMTRSHPEKDGVAIMDEDSLRIFAQQVGFSPGIKVMRKKAGHGLWYGCDKATLLRLLIRVYDEQIESGRGGRHEGVFRNCIKADDVMKILNVWYGELRGEELG